LYLEDAIKLKPSVELRIGFRGEFTSGWKEAQGRASNYAFDTAGVIATQPVVGNSPFTVNKAKFLPAPRVAIAWSPFASKKTVIRAGAGLYYALLDNLSYRLDQNGPYNAVSAVKNIAFSNIAPDAVYAGAKAIPSGVQPDLRTPTVESWTLKNRTTSLAEHGAGRQLRRIAWLPRMLSVDANLPTPTILPSFAVPGGLPSWSVFYYPPGAPLANHSVWNTTHWLSEGISSYHGLEVDVNRRLSHGLQFRGVYTFSKTLDDGRQHEYERCNKLSRVCGESASTQDRLRPGFFRLHHAAVFNAT